MGDAGDRGLRWSEREVGLILKRALELQEEDKRHAPTALQRSEGASLAELEEMALEVGVEPGLVRRAAAELEARPRPVDASRWTGGPRRIIFERALHGEAPEAAIESLIGVLQDSLGEQGQASMVGRTFTWTSLTSSGRHDRARQLTITVSMRDGATRIRVEEQLHPTSRRLFGMLGGIGGMSTGVATAIGVGALGSPLAAAALWLVIFGSTYVGVRTLYRRTVRKRTEELQALLVRMTEHLQSALDDAAPASKGELTSGDAK